MRASLLLPGVEVLVFVGVSTGANMVSWMGLGYKGIR